MKPKRVVHKNRCTLIAGDPLTEALAESFPGRFNRVISDIAKVYPRAILVGAAAAAQYITHENEPRITYDVDILLEEKDLTDFLEDEIPEETLVTLETYFEDSDSVNHSFKHRETGIYVDILSTENKAIRKKIVRYILENRDKTTNTFQVDGRSIAILKPEFLIAMKLNRYAKGPRSERGLCDRVDIMKMFKALWDGDIRPDRDIIRLFCNQNEARHLDTILNDVESELKK